MPSMLRYSTEPINIAFVGNLGGTTDDKHIRPFYRDGCVFLYLNTCEEKDMNDRYGFQRGKKRWELPSLG
ncbi:hypothetical protein BTW01_15145 [Bacillus sp. SKDU12]|nr:hypothetical protein BTW01_15145 [Bacillus sp. SKDU12]